MNKLEVLVSAMHQNDLSLIEKICITSQALIINQCDRNDINEKEKIKMISTTERGLSKSRNLAITNAKGNICLICDDDEILYQNYEKMIIDTYEQYPQADIICFKVLLKNKKYAEKVYRVGFLSALKISSVQMTFKLSSIQKNKIKFDEDFGSGTFMGSGEENIFIYDCLKKGLKVYYIPVVIGEVKESQSQWFKGFNEDYFYKRGSIIYRLMGYIGVIYCLYFLITKWKRYRYNLSFSKALCLMLKGMYDFRINKS